MDRGGRGLLDGSLHHVLGAEQPTRSGTGGGIDAARRRELHLIDQRLDLLALEQLQAVDLAEIGHDELRDAAFERAKILVRAQITEGEDRDGVRLGRRLREGRFLGQGGARCDLDLLVGQEHQTVVKLALLPIAAGAEPRLGVAGPGRVELTEFFVGEPEVDQAPIIGTIEHHRGREDVARTIPVLLAVVGHAELGEEHAVGGSLGRLGLERRHVVRRDLVGTSARGTAGQEGRREGERKGSVELAHGYFLGYP